MIDSITMILGILWVIFCCVVGYFLILSPIISAYYQKKKEKEYHALIDTLLSQLQNKTIIVLDSFYIYFFMDWQWTFDNTENLFQLKQPNNNFVKFVRIDTDIYETYFSSSVNFKLREYWEVQEIQEFVNNTVIFTEEFMVKLVEPHKIFHEYLMILLQMAGEIILDAAYKNYLKPIIPGLFLKHARFKTMIEAQNLWHKLETEYFPQNKEHIKQLVIREFEPHNFR